MTAQSRAGGDAMIFLGVLAAGLFAAWYGLRNAEVPLPSSAMGTARVAAWLDRTELEVLTSAGSPVDAVERIGLRLLPILDTNLRTRAGPPPDREAFLASGVERELSLPIAERKLTQVPSLVIAPKWRRAVRLSGYAHQSLLLAAEDAARPLRQLGLAGSALERAARDWSEVPSLGTGPAATVYRLQSFATPLRAGCEALLSAGAGAPVLLRCKREAATVYALSDPDLLNNHGFGLGDTPGWARATLAELAGSKAILIDTSTRIILRPNRPPPEPRNWADIARFVAWPFTLLWGAVAAALALALWRGGVRFGPMRRIFQGGVGAARAVSITAQGRLMRLSGHDTALLAAHVEARLATLAAELLGERAAQNPSAALAQFLARRTGQATHPLLVAAAAARSAPGRGANLLALLERFEREVEKVRHDVGRVERALRPDPG